MGYKMNAFKWHLRNYKELHGKGSYWLKSIRELERVLDVRMDEKGIRYTYAELLSPDPARLKTEDKVEYLYKLRKKVQDLAVLHWKKGHIRHTSKYIKFVETYRDYGWCGWNEFLVQQKQEWEKKHTKVYVIKEDKLKPPKKKRVLELDANDLKLYVEEDES